MKFLKPLSYGLAVGVTLAAFALPSSEAEARVIAYSSLQVDGFQITSGGEIIDITSVTVVNTTTSAASLNGVNDSNSSPVNGAPGNPVANSDVDMSCVGACGGIAENNYAQYSAANPGVTFARGDAQLTGSLLTPGGAAGDTVAETQLVGDDHQSSAGGAIQSIANFTTIEFTTGEGGDIDLTFDVFGELLAFSDEEGGVALADFDFNIVLQDITNGGTIDIGVSSLDGATNFSSMNQLVSAVGVETQNYILDDTFFLTVSGLLSENTYRLQISQNSDVSASSQAAQVAEPASMGLLGLGLLGLGGLIARRRRTA